MAVPELAPLEVKRQLDAGEPLRILDVREPWERAIVSLPGSLNIPMGEIPARWRELDAEAQLVDQFRDVHLVPHRALVQRDGAADADNFGGDDDGNRDRLPGSAQRAQ